MILNYVLKLLVLFLIEKKGVKNIFIEVNGKVNFIDEKGGKLIKFVDCLENVNIGSF